MARRIKKYRLVHEIDEDGLLAEARSSSSEKSFEDSTLLSASIQDGKVFTFSGLKCDSMLNVRIRHPRPDITSLLLFSCL